MQKEKLKKTENHKKAIKDQILITCSSATAPEKGAC
jgi:flagellar basal body-associated protein FliL